MDGWIKLHRQLVEWEWYKDEKVKSVFIHLLIKANHQDNRWQGIVVKKGQVITGRKVLAEELGLSERSIRTSLNKLKSTNEIAIKPTNKFTVVTLVNWDLYQFGIDEATNEVTSQPSPNRPASDHTIRNKEVKNKRRGRAPKNIKQELEETYAMLEEWANDEKTGV